MKYRVLLLIILIPVLFISISCSNQKKNVATAVEDEVIKTNQNTSGTEIELSFVKGKAHNHPLMAVWIESMDGKYIQTLYVAQSIAKGVFNYGDKSKNFWQPGEIRRPAALPYWSHKRGVKESDGLYIPTAKTPMPDAVTAATPKNNFTLYSVADELKDRQFKILFEINQTWDWNDYWHNNKYPDDTEYKTSCQPSVIYSAEINLDSPEPTYEMKAIGHGHYAGKTGELFNDLSTLTSALHIAEKITVKVKTN